MKDLELIVKQEIGAITTNFEEIKANLENEMKEYQDAVVDEANKTERKKTVAMLRKKLVDIKDKKTEVKNMCLKPYLLFEEKANELSEIINKPIGLIDSQIKDLDERQRQEKKIEIRQIFEDSIGELEEIVSLDSIYDKKWENVSTSIKSIKEDISTKIANINQGITVLKANQSDKKNEALDLFLINYDLVKALDFINRYEQQKLEILQRQQAQKEKERERELELERERIRKEELSKIAEENRIREEEKNKALLDTERKIEKEKRLLAEAFEIERIKEQEALKAQIQEDGEDVVLCTYTVNATPSELEQIELYMSSIGIEFERNM